jgi:hypothetical protein
MKRFLLLSLLALYGTSVLRAQYFTIDWASAIGGSSYYDAGTAIAVDAAGNRYTAGAFNGFIVDFDPGPGSAILSATGSAPDVFILKTDAAGNYLWAKRIGGTGTEEAAALLVDPVGAIYLAGNFTGTSDFDPGPGTFALTSASADKTDFFVAKLDVDGNLLWANRTGGTGTEGVAGLAFDPSGNLVTVGHFASTTDFDPGTGVVNVATTGAWDIFVRKLDPDGNFLWVKTMGGTQEDYAATFAVDSEGSIYLGGSFFGTTDLDPGPGVATFDSYGAGDIFFEKLDNDGNFIWARQMGSVNNDQVSALTVDPDGRLLIAGYFVGDLDIDPGPATLPYQPIGSSDAFVQLYEPSGELIRSQHFGGPGLDLVETLAFDPGGNLYIGGYFTASADLDPGPGIAAVQSNGSFDVFLQKFDPAGELIWAFSFGAAGDDLIYALELDAGGAIQAAGSFFETFDVDPGPGQTLLTPNGSFSHIFLFALSQGGKFQGTVYHDANGNGMADPGEPGLPGILVEVPARDVYAVTDTAGRYRIYSEIAGDTVRPILPLPYWTATPSAVVADTAAAMDFGLVFPPGICDATVTAVELDVFRPGFETILVVQVKNHGTTWLDPIVVTLDSFDLDVPLEYLSAVPLPDAQSAQSLTWELDPLAPGAVAEIRVRFRTPWTVAPFSLFDFNIKAPVACDVAPADNVLRFGGVVFGSYDPNDKQVAPAAVPPFEVDSTDLRYVIRFQNTGNLPADFVVIRDTLPDALDIATLRLVMGSHAYTWTLEDNRVLVVRFDAINLPDSLSNEPASHGFIVFTIRPKTGLTVGDSIANRAAIYFDYNLPVITGFAVMKVTSSTMAAVPADPAPVVVLRPNPAGRDGEVLVEVTTNEPIRIALFDTHGRIVRAGRAGERRIRLDGLAPALYFAVVQIGTRQVCRLLLVQ